MLLAATLFFFFRNPAEQQAAGRGARKKKTIEIMAAHQFVLEMVEKKSGFPLLGK